MLNLKATYTPKVYQRDRQADKYGEWITAPSQTVTIIAVLPTAPDEDPSLLAVTEEGAFVYNYIQYFTYTGHGSL